MLSWNCTLNSCSSFRAVHSLYTSGVKSVVGALPDVPGNTKVCVCVCVCVCVLCGVCVCVCVVCVLCVCVCCVCCVYVCVVHSAMYVYLYSALPHEQFGHCQTWLVRYSVLPLLSWNCTLISCTSFRASPLILQLYPALLASSCSLSDTAHSDSTSQSRWSGGLISAGKLMYSYSGLWKGKS